MANDPDQVSTKTLVDTKRKPLSVGRRREWPEALKRQMVAEKLDLGSSVSIVAGRHDANTNQLFKCRRELVPTGCRRWSRPAQWCRSRCQSGLGMSAEWTARASSRSSLTAARG